MNPANPSTPSTSLPPLAFIGGGNMALAILGGLRRGGAPAEGFIVVAPIAPPRALLRADLGIEALSAADASLESAGFVVWAAEPTGFSGGSLRCLLFVHGPAPPGFYPCSFFGGGRCV